jgi:uncharacterized membrane protein
LIQSHEPLFFTALVGPISLIALAAYYVTPICKEKLLWDRRPFWPFFVSGFFETLAVLLMLLAFSRGPVVAVSPIASTTPIWTLIISAIFLRQVERITIPSAVGTLLVVAGVVAKPLTH